MSPTAIALVLTAAIAHASWNLFSKQASATGAACFIWLLSACAVAIYIPVVVATVIAVQPRLTGPCWVFMAGTGILQSAYFLVLLTGYRLGDLSLVYPISRGSGALIAATLGIVLLGERLGPVAIAGILSIISGVVLISLPASPPAGSSHRSDPKAIAFALVTGMFIGGYTIWDSYAVQTLHTPAILQGYAAFPTTVALLWPAVARKRQRLGEVWRGFRPQVLAAAVLAPLAYMLVLAALRFTAVAAVAPTREVSVLFGVLLGRRMLGEHGLARRLAAAAAIVAGIIAVAVG